MTPGTHWVCPLRSTSTRCAELNVGDINQLEPNIHAGIKYMRFMMDQYYKDDPMDDLNKALMTLASMKTVTTPPLSTVVLLASAPLP